jgi:hypothetical protein
MVRKARCNGPRPTRSISDQVVIEIGANSSSDISEHTPPPPVSLNSGPVNLAIYVFAGSSPEVGAIFIATSTSNNVAVLRMLPERVMSASPTRGCCSARNSRRSLTLYSCLTSYRIAFDCMGARLSENLRFEKTSGGMTLVLGI